MNNAQHYLVTHIQPVTHDNPDGRIAEDIRIATEEAISLCHSLVYSFLVLLSFTSILWSLSGETHINLGFVEFSLRGHLVGIALIYAATASFLGWRIGKPLIFATDNRQTAEANFRFGLVTAREHSLAIALIHGEQDERQRLNGSFNEIIAAFNRQTKAMSEIMMFTSGYSILSTAFPILVSAPRYVLGAISLGSLMQSVQAFQQTTSALSWPVDNMSAVAQWRASVERVLGLVKALDALTQELENKSDTNRITLEKGDESVLKFEALCVARLDKMVCVGQLNADIHAGERVLMAGDAFAGSKLFKAITGLWPWGTGRIQLPDDEPIFFMPPRPYLPAGKLKAAICYPLSEAEFSDEQIYAAMRLAGVEELMPELDTADCWDKSLEREQQQRLGVVRLLLRKPKWILIQESFDSLDPEGEVDMYRRICQELPNATLLTVTNQPTAEAFHQRKLML